jgi:hypothetical protein
LSIDAEFVRRVLTQMSSVTQGGPNFASPRVQPEASAPPPASVPQASLAPHGPVNAPAAPVSESANVERFVANATQQLNSAARQVTDDVLRQLTAAADRLRDERESLARTDHLHQQHRTAPSGRSELLGSAGKLHEAISHADAVHQRLGQSVADAEQRIEAIVQRAGRIESSLHRVLQQMDTAGERCAPVISQLRTHTDQARKILGQTRTAISAAESSVQTTRRARDEVEQTAERLRQQSLRGGQLTLTLKSAYDRLTRQTVLLDQRANGEAESPRDAPETGHPERHARSGPQAGSRDRRESHQHRRCPRDGRIYPPGVAQPPANQAWRASAVTDRNDRRTESGPRALNAGKVDPNPSRDCKGAEKPNPDCKEAEEPSRDCKGAEEPPIRAHRTINPA